MIEFIMTWSSEPSQRIGERNLANELLDGADPIVTKPCSTHCRGDSIDAEGKLFDSHPALGMFDVVPVRNQLGNVLGKSKIHFIPGI